MAREIAEQPSEVLPGLNKGQEAIERLRAEHPEKFLDVAYGKVPAPVEISGPDGEPVETSLTLASLATLTDEQISQLAGIVGEASVPGADQGGATAEAAIDDKQVLPLDGSAAPGVV